MADQRPSVHLLIVIPGAAPAALIERAILRLRDAGRLPHEVHVIAPDSRLEEVRRQALADGRFAKFCEAHDVPRDEILFNARTLHALPPLLPPDCMSGAERVFGLLRSLTTGRDTRLTVVVADEAGIVGHLVHACLQIVARVDDRLLLDPERRAVPRTPDDPCAPLELPLLLPRPDEPPPDSYAEATARRRTALRRLVRPDTLRLDPKRRIVRVGETSFVLPAMQFFWLWYLAGSAGERFPLAELSAALAGPKRQGLQLRQKLSDGSVRMFPDDLKRAFSEMFPAAVDKFDAMFVRACGPHPGLPSTVSKINAAFRRALGPGARPYLIQGGRGTGGYRVTLPASAIQIGGRVKSPENDAL